MEKLLYRDRKKERLPRIGEDKRKGKPGYAIARTLLQQFTPSQPLAWIQPVGIGGHSAVKHNNSDSTVTQVSSIQTPQFKIYPNPAKREITLVYNLNSNIQNAKCILYDVFGNEITTWYMPIYQTQINEDISFLSSGFYLYCIIIDNKVVQRGKLTIEK